MEGAYKDGDGLEIQDDDDPWSETLVVIGLSGKREMRTVEDLANVVSSIRSMLQPDDGRGEVGSVWVARFARGRQCLGRFRERVVGGGHN